LRLDRPGPKPGARLLLAGHFYYSGEIPRLSSFEKGRTDHLARAGADVPWEPDPLLMDERMLVAHVRDLGLVVFSACSHAGIVSVCTHVRTLFPDIPIHCVMGGLHLGGVMERIIPQTVDGLRPFAIRNIITAHCTGWRALRALANASEIRSVNRLSARATPSRLDIRRRRAINSSALTRRALAAAARAGVSAWAGVLRPACPPAPRGHPSPD
jgi:hypothetical protein